MATERTTRNQRRWLVGILVMTMSLAAILGIRSICKARGHGALCAAPCTLRPVDSRGYAACALQLRPDDARLSPEYLARPSGESRVILRLVFTPASVGHCSKPCGPASRSP